MTTTDGGSHPAAHVVLAVDPPALAALVAASPDLVEQAPELAARMPAFGTPGPPYAVARYWCDGDVAAPTGRCSAACPGSPLWTR